MKIAITQPCFIPWPGYFWLINYVDELVFLEKGRQTLEDFIMSRYHMFGQVYLNKRTIGIEHLVRVVLERTEQLIENNYRFKTNIDKLKPFFKNEVSIKKILSNQKDIILKVDIEGDEYNLLKKINFLPMLEPILQVLQNIFQKKKILNLSQKNSLN